MPGPAIVPHPITDLKKLAAVKFQLAAAKYQGNL